MAKPTMVKRRRLLMDLMITATAFKIKDEYNEAYDRSISILMWSAVAYSFAGMSSQRSTKMASSDWAVAGSLPGDGPSTTLRLLLFS
jgi:hypothetical protein